MEQGLDQHWSESDLARAVNLSSWRLCHLFKTEIGVAPLRYLREIRLERAKRLLETTFLSVKQIRCMVGIKDGSHFVRDFKRKYGLAPTPHRAQFGDITRNSRLGHQIAKLAIKKK